MSPGLVHKALCSVLQCVPGQGAGKHQLPHMDRIIRSNFITPCEPFSGSPLTAPHSTVDTKNAHALLKKRTEKTQNHLINTADGIGNRGHSHSTPRRVNTLRKHEYVRCNQAVISKCELSTPAHAIGCVCAAKTRVLAVIFAAPLFLFCLVYFAERGPAN